MASLLNRLSFRTADMKRQAEKGDVAPALSGEALDFFNETAKLPFAQQAVAFLNAYWEEVGDQAEFICTWLLPLLLPLPCPACLWLGVCMYCTVQRRKAWRLLGRPRLANLELRGEGEGEGKERRRRMEEEGKLTQPLSIRFDPICAVDVMYQTMLYADQHTQGITLIHLYEEGHDVDFVAGLYFFEQLCKRVHDDQAGRKWRDDPKYAVSMPIMQTALVRKRELREKVDVNFDGRVSLLEALLYQYVDIASPAEFSRRGMVEGREPENVRLARIALTDVNDNIRSYEGEKARLTALAKGTGVKSLGAAHQLKMLVTSPLAENLQVSLIKAEAAVRMAIKEARAGMKAGEEPSGPNAGAIWWLNKDLAEKKARYGR